MIGVPEGEFLEACGMTGPFRLTATGAPGLPPEGWSGPRPFALIGRDANADLHLDHPDVSRRHVYLQAVEGRVFGMDLGSRTGARREGGVWHSGWLPPGAEVGIGPYEVRVEGDGMGGAESPPPSGDDPGPSSSRHRAVDGLPGVSLEISGPGVPPTFWRMGRVLVLVGSAPECRLRFGGLRMARFQCSLLRTRAGVWVVDLLGDGGTFLNGDFARFARLEDGDELQVGPASIRVKLDSPSKSLHGRGLRALPPPPASGPRGLATQMHGLLRSLDSGGLPPAPGALARRGESGAVDPVDPSGTAQQQMFDQFHQLMMGMLQAFGAIHREQMSAVREDLERLERITGELQTLRATPMAPGPPPPRPGAGPTGAGKPQAATTRPPPAPPGREARPPRSLPESAPEGTRHLDPSEVLRKIQALQEERQGRWFRVVEFLMGAP